LFVRAVTTNLNLPWNIPCKEVVCGIGNYTAHRDAGNPREECNLSGLPEFFTCQFDDQNRLSDACTGSKLDLILCVYRRLILECAGYSKQPNPIAFEADICAVLIESVKTKVHVPL